MIANLLAAKAMPYVAACAVFGLIFTHGYAYKAGYDARNAEAVEAAKIALDATVAAKDKLADATLRAASDMAAEALQRAEDKAKADNLAAKKAEARAAENKQQYLRVKQQMESIAINDDKLLCIDDEFVLQMDKVLGWK